jgi:UDP-glucose 4-epimerase
LENKKGIYKPQNKHHVCTTDLARQIAAAKGKALRTTRFFNPLVRLLARFVSSFNKLFGSLYYPLDGSEEAYNIIDFEESVKQAVCINT